jgi:cobalt-zinc-cadmium efflux system protein
VTTDVLIQVQDLKKHFTGTSAIKALDGVPVGIRIDEVEKTMEAVPGVKAVHHIHVWAISTTENALTAHVVLAELPRMETVKRQLKAELETAGIHHVTLEFESSAEHCPGTCD